jgi:hypothetical protein
MVISFNLLTSATVRHEIPANLFGEGSENYLLLTESQSVKYAVLFVLMTHQRCSLLQ